MTAGRYSSPGVEEKLGSDRPSMPPGDQSLSVMTAQHKAANDRHAALLAGVELSDEQRLAVCKELKRVWSVTRKTHLDDALAVYEEEIRERMGRGKP